MSVIQSIQLPIYARPIKTPDAECVASWPPSLIARVLLAVLVDDSEQRIPRCSPTIASLTVLGQKLRFRKLTPCEVTSNDLYGPNEAEVLAYWYRNQKYLDAAGKPRVLELGPGAGSFTDLVLDVTGEESASRYLSKLLADKRVSISDDNKITFVRRERTKVTDVAWPVSEALRPLVDTMAKNFGRKPEDGLCQRVVYSTKMNPNHMSLFRRIARERIAAFVDEMDDHLIGIESSDLEPFYDIDGNELIRLGVGVYYFEIEKEH